MSPVWLRVSASLPLRCGMPANDMGTQPEQENAISAHTYIRQRTHLESRASSLTVPQVSLAAITVARVDLAMGSPGAERTKRVVTLALLFWERLTRSLFSSAKASRSPRTPSKDVAACPGDHFLRRAAKTTDTCTLNLLILANFKAALVGVPATSSCQGR